MSRKVLSLLVVLAMLVSSISFAFAADTSKLTTGITDANVKAAVEKLGALGMTEGLEDGTYGADQALNRAQAATFIVRALGLESAAKAAAGQATVFSDVPGTHWAAGYISVAQGQGLVEGVGDGLFAPEAPYTYAAAVTVLCRALGYKNEFLPGSWPGNYLAKAADKKITKNVVVTPSGVCNRGAFAVMLANTCDAKVVDVLKYTSTGIEFDESEESLIENKLDIVKVEDVRFIKNNRLGGSEDALTLTGDLDADSDTADTTEEFDLASSNVDDETLIGQRVNVYKNDDNEILHIEKSDKVNATVYYEYIDSITDDGDVKFKYSSKIFDLDELVAATTYLNGTTTGATVTANKYGKFVVEGSDVKFVDLYNGWSKTAMLVKEVSGSTITYYPNSSGDDTTLNIASAYPGGSVVRINGAVATLADIKPFDVVYIKSVDVNSKATAITFVVRTTMTGKVNGMKGSGSDRPAVDIGGTAIDVGDNATFSIDKDETIDALSATASVAEGDIDDMYGADAVAYKDIDNKMRHISTAAETKSDEKFGFVKSVGGDNLGAKIKIYTQDGDDVTYEFEDDTAMGYARGGANAATLNSLTTLDTAMDNGYRFASFKLTKDGEIAENTLLLKDVASSVLVTGDFGTDTMDVANNLVYVDDKNVAVLDVTDNTGDSHTAADATLDTNASTDPDVQSWSSLAEKDEPAGMYVIYFREGEVDNAATSNDVTGIFAVEGNAASDSEGAYLINYFTRDGDTYAKIHRSGQTAAEELLVSGTVQASVYFKESALVVKKTSGDKVDVSVADADFTTIGGVVSKISGSKYYIGSTKDTTLAASYAYGIVKADSDTVVYTEGTLKSTSDIQVGDVVVAVVKNGVMQAVEWTPSDSGDNNFGYATAVTVTAGAIAVDANANIAYEGDVSAVITAFDATTGQYIKNNLTGATQLGNGAHTALVWKRVDRNQIRSIVIIN